MIRKRSACSSNSQTFLIVDVRLIALYRKKDSNLLCLCVTVRFRKYSAFIEQESCSIVNLPQLHFIASPPQFLVTREALKGKRKYWRSNDGSMHDINKNLTTGNQPSSWQNELFLSEKAYRAKAHVTSSSLLEQRIYDRNYGQKWHTSELGLNSDSFEAL